MSMTAKRHKNIHALLSSTHVRGNIFILILLSLCPIKSLSQAHSQAQRQKVGLVLGGGGAKGAAEIGVLKVLEAEGIQVDYIAGTSIGAILGGLYSIGYRAEELERLFCSQSWIKLFKNEALKGGSIEQLLDSVVTVKEKVSFDELPIPFRCVTVDIKKMEVFVIEDGSLPLAMRASMAIPGVFKAVKWEGRTLVDGGLLNNLPVDVVKKMGADVIIAVDLQQNKHKTRDFSLKKELGIGGILDWLISRPDWKRYNENREDADIYINPKLDYDVLDFEASEIKEIIAIGKAAAEEQVEKLRALKRIWKK